MNIKILKSVQTGIEWDLTQAQIDFLESQMRDLGGEIEDFDKTVERRKRIPSGRYYSAIQGHRYGLIDFQMPKNGYLSFIGYFQFKNLNQIAKKSNTAVYINNMLPESVYEKDVTRITFLAQPC